MKRVLMLVAATVMALAPMTASAARVFVGVGGPYWGPAYYGSYWGPVYGAYPSAVFGEVKFDTKAKDAQVFVNGAFAGTIKEAKTLHLRQGSYNIEVRRGGEPSFTEQVFVTAGKTVHLQPAV